MTGISFDPRQLIGQALKEHKSRNYAGARLLYQQILDRDPGNADALHLYGCLCDDEGDIEQAAKFLTSAVERNPLAYPYFYNLANVLAKQGALDEAQRALKLGSSYREARNYDLAQKYIQRGIELANKAGNRYWEATGYEYLGLVYRDIGDRDAALSALQKASDMFTGIIKQPNGSQNSTQALMDDVRRNDRSRPPANASSGVPAPSPPPTWRWPTR